MRLLTNHTSNPSIHRRQRSTCAAYDCRRAFCFAPDIRKNAVHWLLSLAMLCQVGPAVSAPQNEQPAATPVSLEGSISKFATGADRQANAPPVLRPQSPVMDSSPAPNPLRVDRSSGYAGNTAPRGLSAGSSATDTSSRPAFPLHAQRFGGFAGTTAPPGLRSGAPVFDPSSAPPYPLRADRLSGYVIDVNQARALAKYDLEIIIDRSMSMRRRDCPGGLSRWDWCAYQAQDLAAALSPFAPNGMTISRFATDFDVHERSSAQQVAWIMQQRDFQFGTLLSQPLAARLDAYFRRHRRGDKPLMLAVITDGRPFPRPEPRIVRDVLVRASLRMAEPGEVKVVFLQIGGDDPRGEAYLMDLATNLVNYGARFQYVQTVTFDRLMRMGLARALVQAASG